MAYYIYENWQAGPHKAVLHRGTCGHCNDGRGRAGGYDPNHAKWHGPFQTIEDARSFSKSLPSVVNHRECRCI